jgi:HlyD family secretion protein
MDIARPDLARAKRKKRILLGSAVGLLLAAVTVLLSGLKPALPKVDRSLVLIDTVKRGQLLRQVRGLGTLVPEEIRWIAARTSGRVDQILLRPGSPVSADSVILRLANPDVEQAAFHAESQLKAAEAELLALRVALQSGVLQAESVAAAAKSEYEQSRIQAEVNDQLARDGLISALELKLSRVRAEQSATRHAIEQKRFRFAQDSIEPQLAVKLAEVDRLRAVARLRRDEVGALAVRAGMDGVLQFLPVEVGAQVNPGVNLARVANPARLKAEIRVPETQAKDVQIGQAATVDTRNGVVAGRVARVDPAVQNGTVTVDVVLTGEPPKGARPDLSVAGVIELERLEDVIFVGRPAFGQEGGTVSILKLDTDGATAGRTPVRLGRSAVSAIEIVAGLQPGDRVILSDLPQWEHCERIRLH